MKHKISKVLSKIAKPFTTYCAKVFGLALVTLITATCQSIVCENKMYQESAQASNISIELSDLTKEILSEEKTPQQGNGQTTPWKVYVDGVQTNVVPILYKDANYLPIRATGNALNAGVDWNGENKVAIVEKDKVRLELPQAHNKGVVIDKEKTSDNEEAKQLSSTDATLSVININSSTYLPLRFIGEQLGYTITVDVNTKSAYFNSPGYTPAETPTGKAPVYYGNFGKVVDNPYNVIVPEKFKGCESAYIGVYNNLKENTDPVYTEEQLQSIMSTIISLPPNDLPTDEINPYRHNTQTYRDYTEKLFNSKEYDDNKYNSRFCQSDIHGTYYGQPYYEVYGLTPEENNARYWNGNNWDFDGFTAYGCAYDDNHY